MGDRQKRSFSRGDKEEAGQQGQHLFQAIHLPGVGALPISVAERNAARISLMGRQALALLRILERHRAALEGVSVSKPENCQLRFRCADPHLWGVLVCAVRILRARRPPTDVHQCESFAPH